MPNQRVDISTHKYTKKTFLIVYACIFHCPGRTQTQAETQTPQHLRSLEAGQNICLLILVYGCNKRSCRERTSFPDQVKTSVWIESVAASARKTLFSLTFDSDLKGGAIAFVFWSHFTPVTPGVSGDHFDDLHFVSIDLREEILIN